jgi:hypothetical protein
MRKHDHVAQRQQRQGHLLGKFSSGHGIPYKKRVDDVGSPPSIHKSGLKIFSAVNAILKYSRSDKSGFQIKKPLRNQGHEWLFD